MRTITDGLPYYCNACGLGWNEYGACEELECELESEEAAIARSVSTLPPTPQIGNYLMINKE